MDNNNSQTNINLLSCLKDKICIYGLFISALFLSIYLLRPLIYSFNIANDFLLNRITYFGVIIVLLLAFSFYYKVYNLLDKQKTSIKKIFFFFIAFNFIFLFLKPITSTDLFSYVGQGRIYSIHHASPYTKTYNDFPQDKFKPIIKNGKNENQPTPYGPLFITIMGFLTLLGAKSFALTFFLYKLTIFAVNIIIFLILYLLSKKNIKSIYLYAWNPLIIFDLVANGHNDIFMILFVFISFWLITKKINLPYALLSFWFMLLAVYIKFIPLLLLPFLFLYLLKKLPTNKRLLFSFLLFLVVIFSTIILYFPFWQGSHTLDFVANYAIKPVRETTNALIPLLSFSFLNFFNIANPLRLSVFIGKIFFILLYLFIFFRYALKWEQNNLKSLANYSVLAILLFDLGFIATIFPWYYIFIISMLILNIGILKKYSYTKYVFFITTFAIIWYMIVY